MNDVPLARALRVVEKLIAKRMAALQHKATEPGIPRYVARGAHQRMDELGALIGEIRAARQANEDAAGHSDS